MKDKIKNLPWKIIIILALVQLARPALSIAGVFDNFRPQGPLIATALIAVIWVGVAAVTKLKRPMITLAIAGIVYAIVSVLGGAFLQSLFNLNSEDVTPASTLLTSGFVGSIVYNAIWGAFLGLIAFGIQKLFKMK